ncbi:hypothetical protein G210_2686 [Candida maltosa Xu316]|uniref:Uncharacterized protein n=1 Tax=Candida maltosa (strain Xu316) TaxID=1245528 RepID=M3HI79_CANMX|nr:hypothetical protein G210_2686 [Candida maltosa Xu316]
MFNPTSSTSFRPNIITTTTTATGSRNNPIPNSASSSISSGSNNSLFSDLTDSTNMSSSTNHQQSSSNNQNSSTSQSTANNFNSYQQSTNITSPRINNTNNNNNNNNNNNINNPPSPDLQPPPPQIISGTGASSNPPSNPRISSKFNHHDIQILRQLLLAGEKHKWKQITKELNSSSNHNQHVLAAMANAAAKSHGQTYTFDKVNSGGSPIPAKNVSPTFVIKQFQQILGLPNNNLYFGSLQSSLPYVVAANGWSDIGPEASSIGFDNV